MNIADTNNVDSGAESCSVLLVEDHPAERLRLAAMLGKIGYRVEPAENGVQALELMDGNVYDIILSDWSMPEMDGLRLCRTIKEDQKYGFPYFIMLTGFDSKSDLIAGMDAGADDFITKPFNYEELRVRLQAGHRIQKLKQQLNKNNESLKRANEQLTKADEEVQKDLEIAAYMQKAMLPQGQKLYQGWSMASLYRPASQVSGDAFNMFKLGSRCLGFYHIDVSGHGISAAMLSFTLMRLLGGTEGCIDEVEPDAEIDEGFAATVIHRLNQRFQSDQIHTPYFTIVYGMIDTLTGTGALCQAGHPHPVIVRQDGAAMQLGEGGFPVGTLEDAHYSSTPFQLSAGERLLVYSDGVTEQPNARGNALGDQQLLSILGKTGRLSVDECMRFLNNVLTKWRGENAQQDDISAIMLGRDAGNRAPD